MEARFFQEGVRHADLWVLFSSTCNDRTKNGGVIFVLIV